MTSSSSFVLLFVVATVVALGARRLRVPYTVALVAAGLALGATHALPAPPLTRELMFALILPALLFEAAFDLNIAEIRRDGATLVSLAVPGVIATILIIVLGFAPIARAFDVPAADTPVRQAALIFAALISATDPVAVVALFRALNVPRRLQVIVEGESLLNDGTAIIFFAIALGSIAGSGPTATVPTDFLYIVGGGIMVGGVVGGMAAAGIRRLQEPTLEVMLTTLAAYGSFAAAEGVRASGVIATVTAGLLCGSSAGRSALSAAARISASTFWSYVAFVLNSLVFLSIGLMVQVPMLLEHWRAIVAAYLVVTLSRALVTAGVVALLPERLRLPPRWAAILAWGGLRGALSMVLALSIPASLPQRDLLITITFGVVILSILVQGITIGPALKWLGLMTRHSTGLGYGEMRAALLTAHSALEDVERTGSMVVTDEEMRRALAIEYEGQLDRAERELSAVSARLCGAKSVLPAARRLLRDTERGRVMEAFDSGAIDAAQRDRRLAELRVRWWDTSEDA